MTGVQIFTNVGLNQNSLTGDAQGETASGGDNDKSLATTEFVQKIGLKFAGFTSITGATNLSTSQIGELCQASGSTPYTISLFDNSSILDGTTITIISTNTADVTIQAFSGQNITDKSGITSSKILKTGDGLTLVKIGSGLWFAKWLHAGQIQPFDGDLAAIAALGNSVGYLRKTGTDSWIIDTTSPVLSSLSNGMPSYVEPVGGKTISIDTFTVEFALNTGGTRNVYLQFGDDFSASTTFGYPLSDNFTLKEVLIYARSVGSGGANMQIRTNGSSSPAFTYSIPANTNQSHIRYNVSENFNSGDVIAVYGAASANYSHISVRLIFSWRN